MKTFIFLNGNHCLSVDIQTLEAQFNSHYQEGDYIIAVDGGYTILEKLKIQASLTIGDLDSIAIDFIDKAKEDTVIALDKDKDMSDFETAIERIPKKSTEIILFGLTGGRFDHVLANIFALKNIKQPCQMRPYPSSNSNNDERYFLLPEGYTIHLTTSNLHDSINCSLFTAVFFHSNNFSESIVSTDGLKYPLKKDILKAFSAHGLSNEIIKSNASIKCHQGKILIIIDTLNSSTLADHGHLVSSNIVRNS